MSVSVLDPSVDQDLVRVEVSLNKQVRRNLELLGVKPISQQGRKAIIEIPEDDWQTKLKEDYGITKFHKTSLQQVPGKKGKRQSRNQHCHRVR